MNPFIGRKKELEQLQDLVGIGRACLVVVKGRRRIGKTRLVKEFSKGKRFLEFTGLPPTESATPQGQRDRFARQLATQCGQQIQHYSDWGGALYHLSSCLTNEPTVILLDEISWMAASDDTFMGDLKIWWDLKLQDYPNLILIFCGSVSTWIEKNIINSTAFFGRITLQIDVEQLSIRECGQLLEHIGFRGSCYDVFKVLSVTGGIPWYLEQIIEKQLGDENIKRLCFSKKGLLATEFDRIFHDLFNGSSSIYKKILHLLATGMKNLVELSVGLDDISTDSLMPMLEELITAGFVSKHYSWDFKTEKLSTQNIYRLCDNYIRFFIKYIEPNITKIETNKFTNTSLQALPWWDGIIGLHVENLLLNNRHLLWDSLDIYANDIVADNPYIQRATAQKKGCQIDYLIQAHPKTLFVCEFKFRRTQLGLEVVTSVQDKIKRFAFPTDFAVIPVLFYLGDVSLALQKSRYFYRSIDIAQFLEMESIDPQTSWQERSRLSSRDDKIRLINQGD